MLKFAILGFLRRQAMSGYDLARVIGDTIASIWSAQLSQIYRTLRTLEDDGLVTSTIEAQETRPDRRVYTITDAGREAFAGWIGTSLTDVDVVRSPLMLHFFFSAARPVGDTVAQLRVVRQVYEREHTRMSQAVAEQIASAAPFFGPGPTDPVFWEAARRAGELHAKAWLDWIDETIERLEAAALEAPAGPPAEQPAGQTKSLSSDAT